MNSKRYASPQAWYREPWPWLLMLGPAIAIVAGLTTAYLAVVSSDGLVEDDYYQQGLTVNLRTARDQRAAELGIDAEFLLGGEGDRMRALLRGKEGVHLPETLSLGIAHPTRPGFDQKIELRSEGAGVYTGVVTPFAGRWHVTLEDDRKEWRLVGDCVIGEQSVLRLTAAPAVTPATQDGSDNKKR